MNILCDKRKEFAEEFEAIYLQRGFGSMTKNELEILFFHLFKKYGDIRAKSVFDLAREIKLPESKVKRLLYESELMYGMQNKEEMQARFLKLIADAKIQKENGTLRFVIEDRYLRSTIYNDLKQNGYFLDSSFNSEIVSIHKEALVFLLDQYFKDNDKNEVVQMYKEARKTAKKSDVDISFSGVLTTLFDEVLRNTVDATQEGLGSIDYSSLIKLISKGTKAILKIGKIAACVAALV